MMMNLKKALFSAATLTLLTLSLSAESTHYEIVAGNGEFFLLETTTGANWKYVKNGNIQGWVPTEYFTQDGRPYTEATPGANNATTPATNVIKQ